MSLLNDSLVAVTLDGKIIIKYLESPLLTHQRSGPSPTANSSITFDYSKLLLAFSSNSTNIVIIDFNGTVVDEISLPHNQSVVSLEFDSDDQLLVSTDLPSLLILTSLSCPQNFTLNESICVCSPNFVPVGTSCQCPSTFNFINSSCLCQHPFIV